MFFYDVMFGLMGLVIGIMIIWMVYMGSLFFCFLCEVIFVVYFWGICLGIFLFVLFVFEGYVMGVIQVYMVGVVDGGEGLLFVNWSMWYGDLCIVYFLGMYVLQIFFFLGYFVFCRVSWIIVVVILYFSLVIVILFQVW